MCVRKMLGGKCVHFPLASLQTTFFFRWLERRRLLFCHIHAPADSES